MGLLLVMTFYDKCTALSEVIMCPYGRIVDDPQGIVDYSSKRFAKYKTE